MQGLICQFLGITTDNKRNVCGNSGNSVKSCLQQEDDKEVSFLFFLMLHGAKIIYFRKNETDNNTYLHWFVTLSFISNS